MGLIKLIYALFKVRLLFPIGLYRLIAAIHTYGMNIMVLLKLAERFGNKEAELYEWLRPRVARFHVPKNIVLIDQMPYTPVGKLDKKQLKLL